MTQQTLDNSEPTKNIHAPAGKPWVHPPRSGPDATCIRVPFLTAPLCAFGHQPLFGGVIICSDNHCSWRFWTSVICIRSKKVCKKKRWTFNGFMIVSWMAIILASFYALDFFSRAWPIEVRPLKLFELVAIEREDASWGTIKSSGAFLVFGSSWCYPMHSRPRFGFRLWLDVVVMLDDPQQT